MKQKAKYKVWACGSLSYASHREFLSGIFRYLDGRGNWNLKLFQSTPPLTAERLQTAVDEGVDGIILADLLPTDIVPELADTPIPLAIIRGAQDGPTPALAHRRHPTVYIHGNNRRIGELGIQNLREAGRPNTVGFVPFGLSLDWSVERTQSFVLAAREHGFETQVYDSPYAPETADDQRHLADWLLSLSKPAAVMAACDWRAAQVLDACEQAGLSVPEQVSVIGVDNDEFICRHSTPTLSSVHPNHERMGFLTGEALTRLMRTKKTGSEVQHLVIDPDQVFVRESSAHISPSAMLVGRIQERIRLDATKGATVADIANALGVSRRLAELRFRTTTGKTIGKALLETRLETARKMLTAGKSSIESIARHCGFADAQHLAHRFSERFGKSPTAYRQTASGSSAATRR